MQTIDICFPICDQTVFNTPSNQDEPIYRDIIHFNN